MIVIWNDYASKLKFMSVLFFCAIPFMSLDATELSVESIIKEKFLYLSADGASMDETAKTVRLTGNVKVTMESFSLEADELVIDTGAGTIKSEGGISLFKGKLRFDGAGLEYDYEAEHAMISKGALSTDGINFFAEAIEVDPQLIVMHKVIASTCSLDRMDYHVAAERIELTTAGRMRLKNTEFHFKDHRILKWPSYSFTLGTESPISVQGTEVKGWVVSMPSLGYADPGGARISSDLKRARGGRDTLGLFGDYYYRDGFFAEARWMYKMEGNIDVSVRLGKRYKENTGYFKRVIPVIVWSQPSFEISAPDRKLTATRMTYSLDMEAGRIKESHMKKPEHRAYVNLNASYPINPKQKYVFSLIGDARLAVYREWEKYRVLGAGAGVAPREWNKRHIQLHYMKFGRRGATDLLSDYVDTDEAVYGYFMTKITNHTGVYTNAQYNFDRERFDEVVLGAERAFNCVKVNVSWHKERKRIGMTMRILR